jgi:hypothetical protein
MDPRFFTRKELTALKKRMLAAYAKSRSPCEPARVRLIARGAVAANAGGFAQQGVLFPHSPA